MTTVACSKTEMAADMLVTYGDVSFLSTKLYRVRGTIVGLAGDANQIESFAAWLKGGDEPDDYSDVDCLMLRKDGIWFYNGALTPMRIEQDFFAIGSGCQGALVAMHMGASPKEAVKLVSQVDPGTGGGVKCMRLRNA